MSNKILPFSVKQSKEKLTDRGGLALLDEFMSATGFSKNLRKIFAAPGSGRGIHSADYVRTPAFHFTDGGRYLEDIEDIKTDEGFNAMIKMYQMPGSDAMGNWLRRQGRGDGTDIIRTINDKPVRRYISVSNCNDYIFDVDGTLIGSDKGDAKYCYKKFKAYHPMTGWLSENGRDNPICSFVEFRQGNASAQNDILEAIQHTETLMPEGKRIKYFRSDSAGYQQKIVDYCESKSIIFAIAADKNANVLSEIANIPERGRKPIHDYKDGFKIGREVAETNIIMNNSNNSFRLVVSRKPNDSNQVALFDKYSYYAVITNFPIEGENGKTAEEVVRFYNGRGNCERFIEDTKYGINLRQVPCGQFEANAMYYTIGMLIFNLLKLMQLTVLPKQWMNRTVLTLRRKFLRMVGKVTHTGNQWYLFINKTKDQIIDIIQVREKMWLLYQTN